jgi:AmmeMemoRadiSam system protein B
MISGQVAAAAFKSVQGRSFDRVLILAPTHTGSFSGGALPEEAVFETPLGSVPVDQEAVERLAGGPHFSILGRAHDEEHAIEVELPFLQVALSGPFKIVPVALGELPPRGLEAMADAIEALIEERQGRGQRWLVVASSDTYHGYDRHACQANDEALTEILRSMDATGLASRARGRKIMACGWKAIALTILLADRRGARECRIAGRDDSTRGQGSDEGRYVVGYVGAAFR